MKKTLKKSEKRSKKSAFNIPGRMGYNDFYAKPSGSTNIALGGAGGTSVARPYYPVDPTQGVVRLPPQRGTKPSSAPQVNPVSKSSSSNTLMNVINYGIAAQLGYGALKGAYKMGRNAYNSWSAGRVGSGAPQQEMMPSGDPVQVEVMPDEPNPVNANVLNAPSENAGAGALDVGAEEAAVGQEASEALPFTGIGDALGEAVAGTALEEFLLPMLAFL